MTRIVPFCFRPAPLQARKERGGIVFCLSIPAPALFSYPGKTRQEGCGLPARGGPDSAASPSGKDHRTYIGETKNLFWGRRACRGSPFPDVEILFLRGARAEKTVRKNAAASVCSIKKQASDRSLFFYANFFGNLQKKRLIFPLYLRCPVRVSPRYPSGAERASTLSGVRAKENALAAVRAFRTQARDPRGDVCMYSLLMRISGSGQADGVRIPSDGGAGRNKTAPHHVRSPNCTQAEPAGAADQTRTGMPSTGSGF